MHCYLAGLSNKLVAKNTAASSQNVSSYWVSATGFALLIRFLFGSTSNYRTAQITKTHNSLLSLLQSPLVVACLQFSNKGYSSRPYDSRTAFTNPHAQDWLFLWSWFCDRRSVGQLFLVSDPVLGIHDQIFPFLFLILIIVWLLTWGALSDKRTGLQFAVQSRTG
jgi:hypothetical protein